MVKKDPEKKLHLLFLDVFMVRILFTKKKEGKPTQYTISSDTRVTIPEDEEKNLKLLLIFFFGIVNI